MLAWLGAALLLSSALAAPAAAQVMTITGASPSHYSGAGETITFTATFGQSNAITNAISLQDMSQSVGPLNCAGLPLAPGASTTCTFTYVTTASDLYGIDMFGGFATTTNGGPRSGPISNRYVVPYGDTPPQARVFAMASSVAEDSGSPLRFQVGLDKLATTPVTIHYALGGTATAGDDYVSPGSSVTLPVGAMNWDVAVYPISDTTYEPDETVVLSIVSGSGYTIGSPASASGTITNDDGRPQTITFDNPGTQLFGTSPTLTATASSGLPVVFTSSTTGVCTITSDGTLTFITTGACTIDADQPGNAIYGRAETVSQTFTVAAVVPGAPTDATAVAGDAQATVTFTAPASRGGAAITSYTVTSSPGGITTTGAASPIIVTGLTNGTSYSFTVTATNEAGTGAPSAPSNSVTPVAPITLAPAPPAATVGVAYSHAFVASGGIAPYAFSFTGQLPPGLTLSTAGVLSGTPTSDDNFSFTVAVTDQNGDIRSFVYTLAVAGPLLVIEPGALPDGAIGSAYSQQLSTSGGTAPYSYTLLSGALPGGLSLTSNGSLSGTPTANGTFSFTVLTTDSTTGGGPHSTSLSYLVFVTNSVPVANASTASVAYDTATVIALDITGVVDSIAVTGAPAHGTLSLAGTTPTYTPAAGYAGPDSFTYTASNDGGASAPATVSITVGGPVISVSAGGGLAATVGAPYSQTFSWSGGSAPFSGHQVSGLPAGLSITATTATTATVSGTPTEAGSFSLVASAQDSSSGDGPFTGTGAFTLVVSAPGLALDPAASTFNAGYNTAFSQTFTASGGIGPYSYAITGALPAGIAFDGDTLSGTPTAPGSYPITVTATDTGSTGAGAPFSVSNSYTLVVAAPTIALDPAALAGGTAGQAYSATLGATGGVAPYAFALTTGTLPTGVALAGDGTLSGIPSEAGTFDLTITATDANGQTGSRTYALVVAVPTLAMTPAAGDLPAGTAGVAYVQAFASEGGIAPYAYALTSGSLPAGLSLGADGRLSGTPTETGTFGFSVTTTDGTAGTAGSLTQAYTLAIDAPSISVGPDELPAASFGTAYSATLVAAGGTAPYRFAITGGALPTGLALSADGVLSGTPTQPGVFELEVTATDALGFTGARRYSLRAVDRPDPSQDPEVRGLIDAQVQSARRFARAQVDNFHQRLERLHGGRRGAGVDSAVSVVSHRTCMQPPGPDPSTPCVLPTPALAPDATGLTADSTPLGARETPRGFGAWIGGSIRSGSFDGMGGSSVGFESDGISIGFDYDLSPAFTLGAGLGHGRDRNDVGDIGSRIDGRANALAGYASYHPGRHLFVDGLLGYQTLDFDLRRQLTAVDGSVRGQRNGDQWFGSLSMGADLQKGALQLTPYARFDMTRGSLDSYTESGHAFMALHYEAMDVDSTTANLGLRMDYGHRITAGWLMPRFRIEYQRELEGSGNALVRYADLAGGPFYTLTPNTFDRSRFMLGLGLGYETDDGWSTRMEYRGEAGSGDQRDNGVMISVQKDY